MDYEIGEKVWFDGGPAKVIDRDIDERTYQIEFTGLTGRRTKVVTSRDLSAMPTIEELAKENAALREQVKALQSEAKDDTSTNEKLRVHKLTLKTALQAIIDDWERGGRGMEYMADTAKEALWKIDN